MRFLLLLVLLLAPVCAGPQATIDDLLESAKQKMKTSPRGLAPLEVQRVAVVPAPAWSAPLAMAGTIVLLTALVMALTSFVLEMGVGWRRPKQIRLRLSSWPGSLGQRDLPQVNFL